MLYTTRTGKSVDSTIPTTEAVELLTHHNSYASRGFAASLYHKYHGSKKGLSDEQVAWAHILAMDVLESRKPKVDKVVETVSLPNFAEIQAMFSTAGIKLKYPKMTFMLDNLTIRLTKAGDRSKYVGQVIIKDLGAGVYLGRIDTNGDYHPSLKDNVPEVASFLKEFAQNPLAVASAMGKKTGHCCFCFKPLKDEKSVTNGYGPICAKRYGL